MIDASSFVDEGSDVRDMVSGGKTATPVFGKGSIP
jgi:hypothetical protein